MDVKERLRTNTHQVSSRPRRRYSKACLECRCLHARFLGAVAPVAAQVRESIAQRRRGCSVLRVCRHPAGTQLDQDRPSTHPDLLLILPAPRHPDPTVTSPLITTLPTALNLAILLPLVDPKLPRDNFDPTKPALLPLLTPLLLVNNLLHRLLADLLTHQASSDRTSNSEKCSTNR